MIDGTHTTHDWQTHPTDIIVLPIGAFEQHATHLPLDTDSIQCEAISKIIAEELDCALLPTIRIATSLEHTGFRGTFSLKPETLMQVIRDIADDAARQRFSIMIIANGHGGNHCLTPVCRDINRVDGPLKIILVDIWSFGDPGICDGANSLSGLNLHASEEETSLMLTLRPDWVRAGRPDTIYPDDDFPLEQKDLTTFGVGYISPSGAVGRPSDASKEKGEKLLASIRGNIIPFLRDRIARLRKQPRYSGSGGMAIRTMTHHDIADGMRLKTQAGWNQIEADWRLFLDTNRAGCFVSTHNGRITGTVTSLNYGDRIGWIGMVLVDPGFRRMGIATSLMSRAVDALSACDAIKLDATPDGRKVYEKLGFIEESRLLRLTAESPDTHAELQADNTRPTVIDATRAAAVMRRDRLAFGADRSAVLETFLRRAPQYGHVILRNGEVAGYVLARPGAAYLQIGPLVADTARDALSLLAAIIQKSEGRALLLDCPSHRTDFIRKLDEIGFVRRRPFIRMYRGTNRHPGITDTVFAIAGPELG